MVDYFATNMLTWYVIFPILLLAAATIVLLVIKAKLSPWKRVGMATGGLFAFIGFSFVVLTMYYLTSTVFASSFRFYAYTVFAESDPFQTENGKLSSSLMRWGVQNQNGTYKLFYHPNPNAPTVSLIFAPGEFIEAQLKDGVLTIPETSPGSTPRITKTSLWWALNANMYEGKVQP
jgi:hypothetical protein